MAGSVPPARRPPCGDHRRSILRFPDLHRRVESELSGCARGAPYSVTAGAVVPRALGTFGEARPSPGGTIGLGRDQDWAGAGQRSRIAVVEDRSRVAGSSELL